MKAAVLHGTQEVVYEDIERSEPAAGEVVVKVHYTGVCGSDVPRVLQGRVHFFPLVLGHEFSGRIVAVGDGVSPDLVGRRVAGVPLQPCMECEDCLEGNYSLCGHYGFVGSRSQGSMAEYVTLPEKNVVFLGDDVPDLDGAFFEPASVAIHGIELAHFEEGATAAVVGCGTIGILCAQALSGYGASNVVATVRSAPKAAAARAAGVTKLADTLEEDWFDQVLALNDGRRFDYVFDTAGTPETILDSFELAANKARVMFIGTPSRDVAFTAKQWETINRKELTVGGSWMSYSKPWPGVEWDIVNRFFNQGIMRVVPEMLDTVYNLSDTSDAFERYAKRDVEGKILIDSWEEH